MLWFYIPWSWSCKAHQSRVLRNLLALSQEEGLDVSGVGVGMGCLCSYGTQNIKGDAETVHELHGAGSWICYFLSIRIKVLNLSLDFHMYKITMILVFTSLGSCECWIRLLMWRVWCLLHFGNFLEHIRYYEKQGATIKHDALPFRDTYPTLTHIYTFTHRLSMGQSFGKLWILYLFFIMFLLASDWLLYYCVSNSYLLFILCSVMLVLGLCKPLSPLPAVSGGARWEKQEGRDVLPLDSATPTYLRSGSWLQSSK